MEFWEIAAVFAIGWTAGTLTWDIWWNRSMPPKIKRLVESYEDDCRPRMRVGIDPAEHRASFERRWEIKSENRRVFPFWRILRRRRGEIRQTGND